MTKAAQLRMLRAIAETADQVSKAAGDFYIFARSEGGPWVEAKTTHEAAMAAAKAAHKKFNDSYTAAASELNDEAADRLHKRVWA